MSTALERDIRNALADFGRPVPADATLTAGVRELIAAVSESESDRDAAIRRANAAIAERDAVMRGRTEIRSALDTLGAALGMVGIVGIPAPYDLVKAVFAYQDWITARTVIACVVSAIAGAGLVWSVVLL